MYLSVAPTFRPSPTRIPGSEPKSLPGGSLEDPQVFDALFRDHRDGLLRFLLRRLRRMEDAEDAVSLTFRKAWRARASFQGRSGAKAWLYQIASRVALDVHRDRKRRPAEEGLDLLPLDVEAAGAQQCEDPERRVVEADWSAHTASCVWGALRHLSESERTLLLMFYFEELSYEEISRRLGITRSQVRGRLHRIRERVRRELGGVAPE